VTMVANEPGCSQSAKAGVGKCLLTWVLLELLATVMAGCATTTIRPDEAETDDVPLGQWQPVRARQASELLADDEDELVEHLEAIGYLDAYAAAGEAYGVTVYDADRAYNGLNLYTSGHAPEAVLMDMGGKVLHTWRYEFAAVWPERVAHFEQPNAQYWRRVHLYDNGDLLAIFAGFGLIKLDKNSNLLWTYSKACHHDLFVTDEGTIYTLIRKARQIPGVQDGRRVLDDYIVILDGDGTELRRVSIYGALKRSAYSHYARRLNALKTRDIFHTNTIEVLDGRLGARAPQFKAGNVLISILRLQMIAVVDLDKEEVVWCLPALLWGNQHQPTVLNNGRMLIFDNTSGGAWSDVIEFDPFTQEIHWAYRGKEDNGFFSDTLGSCQRLPNGNTLISESNTGRAFEVTPDNTLVWEWISPHRAGADKELVALLPEMIRVERGFPALFLGRR